MEIKIAGGDIAKQYEYALGLLGTEFRLNNIIETGAYADITAITIGKGTQGPVKRWGVTLRKRKHSVGGKERHVGTLDLESPPRPLASSAERSDGVPAAYRVQQAYFENW